MMAGLTWVVAATLASSPPTAAGQAVARLRTLVGVWEGSYEWTGARSEKGAAKARYELTGNGSAVIEHLIMGNDSTPSMSTVYHADGDDLRMTHYCGARNQPRLKAARIDATQAAWQFEFIDATNLQVQPAHVHGFEIRFLAEDRLVLRFTFVAGAKESVEHIELRRVANSRL
jgi:hypothetical protein